MDQIIYDQSTNENVLPIKKQKAESLLDFYTRKIFLLNFQATNEAVGDTTISLEQSETEFFTDNVERFIEHDKLHSLFSQYIRQNPNPIFKKYQSKNDKSITMNRSLFFQGSPQERVQCILEEIIVLIAERKLIPHLIKVYRDNGAPYHGGALIPSDITETIAHFVTDLCGQGHAWLRRWCIDHYDIIGKVDLYDIKMIENICLDVAGIQLNENNNTQQYHLTPIDEFIAMAHPTDVNGDPYLSDDDQAFEIKQSTIDKCEFNKLHTLIIPNDDNELSFTFKYIDVNLTSISGGQLTIKYGKDNQLIQRLLRRWTDCYPILYDPTKRLIYDWKNNIGYYLTYLDDQVLFRMIKIESSRYYFNVVVEKMELDNNLKHTTSEKKHKSRAYAALYYSTDNSCGYRNSSLKYSRYLNSYGNLADSTLDFLVTQMARYKMDIPHDQPSPGGENMVELLNDGDSFDEEHPPSDL